MRNGFTILELLISIAILVLLGSLAVRPLSSFRASESLDASTTQVLSLLHEARENTLASKNDMVYGVHFEESRVVLFSGDVYSQEAGDNKVYEFNKSVHILSIEVSGGDDVIFKRLSGETDNTGTVTFARVGYDSTIRTIEIIKTGVASQIHE